MKAKLVALAVLAAVSGTAVASDSRLSRVPFDAATGQPILPQMSGEFVSRRTAPTQSVAATNPAAVPGVAVAIPDNKASAKRLPAADQKRMAAVRDWERTGVAEALVGANGSIEYPYGYSRPVISCAPLHICTIILQPGEAIVSLSLGDTVRWMASQSTAGNKPVVVVKPTQAAISTNLVVTTDKGRVYYMHLVADKEKYVPIVTFYDPAAMTRTEQNAIAAAEAARMAAELKAQALAEKRDQEVISSFKPGFDPAALDFNYRCKGNDSDILPSRVFASDTHTYLQMPSDMKAKDAPAVFAMRGDQTELLNMRVKGDYYVIDGKPAKLQLLVGVGRGQSSVTCERK